MSKTLSTSGFVYVWRDRKHNRYYVGSHWGTEEDGYVCSSNWMYNTYKRRPEDFTRRIVARVYTNRRDLFDEEHRWLSMIKTEELKNKYYNHVNKSYDHWSADDQRRKEIGEKISKTNTGMKITFKDPVGRGQKISEAKKRKIAERGGFTEEHRKNMSLSRQGYEHTQEWKDNNSRILKEQWATGQRKPATGWKKKTYSKESREKFVKRNNYITNIGEETRSFENYTRMELCDELNIPYGSYYYLLKSGKISIAFCE